MRDMKKGSASRTLDRMHPLIDSARDKAASARWRRTAEALRQPEPGTDILWTKKHGCSTILSR